MMKHDLPKLNDPDYQEALESVMTGTFVPYKGCIILKGKEGFKWGDNWYESLPLVCKAIDDALKHLSESIGIKKWEVSIVHNDGTETMLSEEYKAQYYTGQSPYQLYKQKE